MKRNLIISMLVAMCLLSCKKYEQKPFNILTASNVYDPLDKNGDFIKQVLTDIYSYLPDGYNRIGGDILDDASGDAIPSRTTNTVEYFTNNRLNSTNNPDNNWTNSYKAIRAVNSFLANVDVVPIDSIVKRNYKAEARFIRAISYFEMVKRYGGVPLIGDKILTPNDNLQIPRDTYADCVTYIVSECDAIEGLLPITAIDFGRITRGAAYALKARTLLYAASPLYNGGGTSSDPIKKALTGYPTYDAARWATALTAYQDMITLSTYSLVTPFTNVFTVRSNAEVILAKERFKTFDVETNNAPVGYASPGLSLGYTSPTQELVDVFPMVNGLSITDASSGYDANAPYNNRDPRLGSTVFYNGTTTAPDLWLSRQVETFEGGRDKPGGIAVQTRTGYYMKKFLAQTFATSTATAYSNQDHNFILFRWAEILLGYAECLNEVGRTTEAYTPLKTLRTRAGITAGIGSTYGLKTGMTQMEMRATIQNERRIEMAFEEQRFWDIRRWKIADQVLNGSLHGLKIVRTGTTGTFNYTYTPYVASNVVFDVSKMYTMPLPYAEVVTDLALIQNQGW